MTLSAMRTGDTQVVLCHLLQEGREGFAAVRTDHLGIVFGGFELWKVVIRHGYQMLPSAGAILMNAARLGDP